MGRTQEDFKNLFDNHIHLPSRTIYINENITPRTADRVVKLTRLLDAPGVTITVMLNTYGGEVYEALAIYDALRSCKATVRTIGTGKVMSAGTVILQAGDERLLTPNAVVMCHHMSYGPGILTSEDHRIEADEGTRLQEQLAKIVADRMGKTAKQFLNWCRKEKNISANQAVALGIADRIHE